MEEKNNKIIDSTKDLIKDDKDSIVVMSFDIGEKNFCCAKEKISSHSLINISKQNIPLKQRYDKNGECTPEFSTFLKKYSLLSQITFVDIVDITSKDDKKYGKRRVITNKILIRLSNYLDKLNKNNVFDDVSYFVIEEQMTSATNNQQLQYHLRSYLLFIFLNFKPIVMFPSRFKTQILGAPKKLFNDKKQKLIKMTHPMRKKWACTRVYSILIDRNDNDGIVSIFGKKKSDDMSDCVLMCECFLYMLFVDKRNEILERL